MKKSKAKKVKVLERTVLGLPHGIEKLLEETVILDGYYLLLLEYFSDGKAVLMSVVDDDMGQEMDPQKIQEYEFEESVLLTLDPKPAERVSMEIEVPKSREKREKKMRRKKKVN